MYFSRVHAAMFAMLLATSATGLHAQQVHRIVGPDGRVTYSDRPPAEASGSNTRIATTSEANSNGALPYELRQIANRFPVTLYTADDCSPCNNARNMLIGRGIPFTEKTVNTNEDTRALQSISGGTSLPFGTIGQQQLIGYTEREWAQYLDAAGYPAKIQLPPNYRRPAASALTTPKPADPQTTATEPSETTSRPAPPAPRLIPREDPSRNNPAGIRF